MYSDIVVVGGGAAGLMCAAAAAKRLREAGLRDARVTVVEKMPRVGRKILLTGKGRCNFTNVKPWEEFSPHVRKGSQLLRNAFRNLTPQALVELFEGQGLRCVVERGDRAFPASHRAVDVVDTLRDYAVGCGARIFAPAQVRSVVCNDSADGPVFLLSTDGTRTFSCGALVVCTGGLSYPGTGSTGDGYLIAESFGHRIVETFPSLTAIVPRGYKTGGAEPGGHLDRAVPMSGLGRSLCGLELRNCTLTLHTGDRAQTFGPGEVYFTDGGLEGPLGFSCSRDAVAALRRGDKVSVDIDLKPAVPEGELLSRVESMWKEICSDASLQPGGRMRALLLRLLPKEAVQGFAASCGDKFRKGKAGIDPAALCRCLRRWSFPVEGYVGYERCVVTAGGVDTSEVLPKTLESRLREGLFFAGEVLDIDCDTGGYNLHAAFCTGALAGLGAARRTLARRGIQ